MICPDCHATEFRLSNEKDRFEYGCGDDAVYLSAIVPVETCKKCGYQCIGGDAEDIRHEAVCKHLGRMPPRKIRELRKSHGLSRKQFANVSGIGSASLARWETGSLIQGPAHDNLLYLLMDSSNLNRLRGKDPYPDYETQADEVPVTKQDNSFRELTRSPELQKQANSFSLH